MSAFAGLAALLVAIGVYLVLSECSRKRLLGAGLLVQALPVTVFLAGQGAPLSEAFAVPVLVLGLAVFLGLLVTSGQAFDLHADDD